MSEENEGRFNTAIIRFLPLLDAEHPDARGTILIHGDPADAESYVEIARILDFKSECSETAADFRYKIRSQSNLLLILLIGGEPSQHIKDDIISACETIDPLYAMHITSERGDVPNTDKRYKLFVHHTNIVPGNTAVERVFEKTLSLLGQANEHVIHDGPIPKYIKNLGR